MDESKEIVSVGELKKKVYLVGLRLKNSGMDVETIYARLVAKGIPETIAGKVARDVMTGREEEYIKQARPVYKFCLERMNNSK